VVHLMAILAVEDVATTKMVVEEVVSVYFFYIFHTECTECAVNMQRILIYFKFNKILQ
jgi:hypothetical protein